MILLAGREKRPRLDGFYVYTISCTENGKVYVGESQNVYNRLCGHKSRLRSGTHPIREMIDDFRHFGESAFVFRLEHQLVSKSEALKVEAEIIESFSASGRLYNLRVNYPFSSLPIRSLRQTNALSIADVIHLIKDRASKAGSQRQLSIQWGVNRQVLNAVLKGKRQPTDSMLAHLGLQAATVYLPVE